jgi:hypothetical protein
VSRYPEEGPGPVQKAGSSKGKEHPEVKKKNQKNPKLTLIKMSVLILKFEV